MIMENTLTQLVLSSELQFILCVRADAAQKVLMAHRF